MRNQGPNGVAGYAMAALLVAIGVMAVLLGVAMPAWRQMVQREKEEELIFRGQQYVRAIGLFQRKYAAAFPPSIDTLVTQKFLRRAYRDPMMEDGEFQVIYQGTRLAQAGLPASGARTGSRPGAPASAGVSTGGASGIAGARGGVLGVASKSTAESIRVYNGRNHYNEWLFVYTAAATSGSRTPGTRAAPRGPRGGRASDPR